jgi:nucleoside-triphosphatase THEP1
VKLGYLVPSEGVSADALLVALATRLRAEGVRVAGAIQHNAEVDDRGRCHMDLEILAGQQVLRISQDLGALAQGCRLDPGALEQAVALVMAALGGQGGTRPDLVIVNKFGKQEIDGRGFRPVIAAALEADVPVLVAVRPASLAAFQTFVDGFGEDVPPDLEALVGWVTKARAA